MELSSLENRLKILERYCSDENINLYIKLKDCKEKAIQMDYMEYMTGEKEHSYSNLYSCVYDFKKENNILESMEELMQLMKDIDFNINRKYQIHNFKISNHIKQK